MINKTFLKFLPLLLVSLACMTSAIQPAAPPAHTVMSDATPNPTTQAAPTTAPQCAIVTAAVSLHLRDRPNFKDGKITGYLFHTETVTVTNNHNPQWWFVQINDRRGWASAYYLQEAPCPSPKD